MNRWNTFLAICLFTLRDLSDTLFFHHHQRLLPSVNNNNQRHIFYIQFSGNFCTPKNPPYAISCAFLDTFCKQCSLHQWLQICICFCGIHYFGGLAPFPIIPRAPTDIMVGAGIQPTAGGRSCTSMTCLVSPVWDLHNKSSRRGSREVSRLLQRASHILLMSQHHGTYV